MEQEKEKISSQGHAEKLKEAMKQLNELREARDRQVELVENIVRQRDVLQKQLANSYTSNAPAPSSSSAPLAGDDSEYQELKRDYDDMRREKIEVQKRLERQLEEKSQQYSEAKIQLGQAQAKIQFVEGGCKE